MSLSDILVMRNELLLTFMAILLLTIDLNLNHAKKGLMIPIAIGMFLVVTLIGFIPQPDQALFGGMYHTNGLVQLMKNVLNIGALIMKIMSNTRNTSTKGVTLISDMRDCSNWTFISALRPWLQAP